MTYIYLKRWFINHGWAIVDDFSWLLDKENNRTLCLVTGKDEYVKLCGNDLVVKDNLSLVELIQSLVDCGLVHTFFFVEHREDLELLSVLIDGHTDLDNNYYFTLTKKDE